MLTLSQAIDSRRSVRTFTDRRPADTLLRECGADAAPTLRLLPESAISGGKVGTYGVIKGAPAYVAVIYDKNNQDDTLRAGMDGERFVLECTRRGLGTCWLGGTFNRSDVRGALPGLPDKAGIGCVIAVGYPAEKIRFVERIMRKAVGSDRRKPLDELIVAGQLPRLLREAVEAVRLAPSATNKQPWRFAFNRDGSIDLYGDRRDSFMTLDMGIALCHFLAIVPQYSVLPPRHDHPILASIASLQPK